MILTYAFYEHPASTNPRIVLQWHYTPSQGHHGFIFTIYYGKMSIWYTDKHFNPHNQEDLDNEIKRFEDYIEFRYPAKTCAQG